MPQVGAAILAVAGSISTAMAASPFLALAIRTVGAVALSALGQAMMGSPDKPPSPGLRNEFTTSGEAAPFRFPIGRAPIKGHLTAAFTHTKQGGVPNRYHTQVIELSDMPDAGLLRVMINGQYSDIGEQTASPPPGLSEHPGFPLLNQRSSSGKDYAWIKIYDGTQTEADPFLLSAVSDDPDRPWSPTHIGAGISYAVLTFYLEEKLYSGFPTIAFEMEGIPLYDVRKDSTAGGTGPHRWNDMSTWEPTRNPKVMLYCLLRGIPMPDGQIYGGNAEARDFSLANWAAAMNVCDFVVTGPGGGTRARYEAGLEIDVTRPPYVYCLELDKACGGQTVEVGGSWITTCGPPAPPVMTITDGDISVSDPELLSPHPGLDSAWNGVTAMYASPQAMWESVSIDPIYNSEWEAQDGGRRLVAGLQLNAVYSRPQATHIAKANIKDHRRMRTHVLGLSPRFSVLEPFDTIAWNSVHNQYTNELFEVKKWTLRASDMILIATLRGRRTDDYIWDGSIEPEEIDYPSGVSPIGVQEVEDFLVSPYQGLDSQGWFSGIKVTWNAPEDADMRGVLMQYRLLNGTDRETVSSQDIYEGQYIIKPLEADTKYQVRARWWVIGRETAWSDWQTVTTPDVRIPEIALAGSVQDKLNAADNVQQNLDDLALDLTNQVNEFSDDLVDMQNSFGKEMLASGETVFAPFDGVAPTLSRAYLGLVGQPITDGIVLINSVGWCIDTVGYTAVRNRRAMEALPGRTYEITVRARVNVDDSNPSGNRQRGIISAFGLDQDGNYVSAPSYGTPPEGGFRVLNPFTVASGWQTFKTRVTIQNDWIYWKCGFTYGESGTDARWRFSWMKVEDVTEGSVIRGLVTTLDGRTDTLEGGYQNIVGLNLSGDTALGTLKTSLQVNSNGHPLRINGIENNLTSLGNTVSANYDNLVGLNVSGSTAFGTFLQQLSVNASGVPTRIDSISSSLDSTNSTVTIQGNAISNLQADASASLVMKVTSGGSVASIALVTANNASGGSLFGSRVKIDSDWFQISGMAVFAGPLQSSNFVSGSAGWSIYQNGGAQFNGVVISRQLLLAERTFTYPGAITDGEEFLINTGIRVANDDFWNGNQKTLLAVLNSNDGAYKSSSADGQEIWGFSTKVLNAARWTGSSSWNDYTHDRMKDPNTLVSPSWATGTAQRILVKAKFESKDGVIYQAGKSFTVKVYEVT